MFSRKKLKWMIAILYFVTVAIIFVPILLADDPYDDGRINRGPHLGYAVVYCVDGKGNTEAGNYKGGGIEVYHWTGPAKGTVFFVSEEEIQAVPENPDESVVIKETSPYALYRLPGGNFQLMGPDEIGNLRAFIWHECRPVITISPEKARESQSGQFPILSVPTLRAVTPTPSPPGP